MIIIHAKGNSEIGIGNLSRCFELINYISKKHEVIGIFECNDTLYKRYSQENIYHSKSREESINQISKYAVSIYICDLINPDKKFSDTLKTIGVKKIFYFNGLQNGFEPDILFLTDDFNYEFKEKGFDLYRGFKYYIVGNNIVKNRPKHFIEKQSIMNILICFGGADPALYTEYFAHIIDDNKYNYTIILGPAMSQERKKKIKNIKKENIRYIDSPNNMLELYSHNDLLITLGGMMTYEAMCLGMPVCAVRWEYLSYIIKSFHEKSMVIDLGEIDDAYENMLNLDLKKLNLFAKNSFSIINGKALDNIQKTIENYL